MRLTHAQALFTLHQTLLEILDAIAAFCSAHDIQWFLDSGTALGALRHGGFIPWDDDADVGMLRGEWERFVTLASSEGFVDGFSVHTARDTAGFDGIMAKVFKEDTRFLDQRALYEGFDQGIFVDVFPYDALLANPVAAKRQLRGARLWTYLLYLRGSGCVQVPHQGPLGATERLACALANPLVHALTTREGLLSAFERSIPAKSAATSDIYVPLPYALCHPKATLVPVSYHEFCGRCFPVPADPKAYLTVKYGNWRELPPKKERKSHLPLLIDFGNGITYHSDTYHSDPSSPL